MSRRVEVLGLIVTELKHNLWVDYAYNLINISFLGTYESLDDFLWETSIEATNLLLPSLDLGPNTQYDVKLIQTLEQLVIAKISYKAHQALSELSLNYGR